MEEHQASLDGRSAHPANLRPAPELLPSPPLWHHTGVKHGISNTDRNCLCRAGFTHVRHMHSSHFSRHDDRYPASSISHDIVIIVESHGIVTQDDWAPRVAVFAGAVHNHHIRFELAGLALTSRRLRADCGRRYHACWMPPWPAGIHDQTDPPARLQCHRCCPASPPRQSAG